MSAWASPIVALWALSAAADPICISRAGDVEGLERDPLRVALRIEGRKRGDDWPVIDDDGPCGAGPRIVVGPGLRARVIGGGDGLVELAEVPPDERAAEVARLLAEVLAARGEPTALVEAELPSFAPVAVAEVAPTGPRSFGGFVAAAGLWGFETGPERSLGEVALEGGVTLAADAVELGLRVGFQPTVDALGDAATVSVRSLPLSIVARGGLRWGWVSARIGAAVGIEWRFLDIEPVAVAVTSSERTTAGFVDGELEVAGHLGDRVRVGLTGGVRRWLTWTRVGWDGEAVYQTPTFAVGAGLRVTVALGTLP